MNSKFILTWFLVLFGSINIFGQGKDYEITANELNIREHDNKSSKVIGKLSKGQIKCRYYSRRLGFNFFYR